MRDGSINLDGFHKAASRINSHVRNTPLLDSKPLKNDLIPSGSLFLKLENLQPTGSFKVRGLRSQYTESMQNLAIYQLRD